MDKLIERKKMMKIQLLILVALTWTYEVIDATLCGGVNGTFCCFGYQWNEIQKNCIPCEPGYTGMNCDIECFYPSYGKDCQSACTCEEIDCDNVYGCRNLTEKNVVNKCKGQNGTIACCHGYQWNKEKTKCIPCDKGFTGYNCEAICPFPSYGLDCQAICNCTKANCDPKDGCSGNSTRFESSNPQIQEVTMNAVYSKKDPTDEKQAMFMAGIGVLAAVALFIVLAIIYTFRMENNSKKETDSNIYYTIK